MAGAALTTSPPVLGRRLPSGLPSRPLAPAQRGAAGVFVKAGAHELLEHEARMLEHLGGRALGAAVRVPRLVAVDPSAGTLTTERFDGWPTLHELFGEEDPRELAHARQLGWALAALHARGVASLPPAAAHLPNLDLTPTEAARASGETLALMARLQRSPALARALERLRSASPVTTLIHGDLKLDNVLAQPGGERLCLVDWEHAGAGDPAWDLGAGVGDYLSRWLLSSRPSAAASLAGWLGAATASRRRCAAACRALLGGYADGAPRTLPVASVGASAGVFLLHRAQAWVARHARLTAKPVLLAAVGERLVVAPASALAALLGDRP